MSEQIEMYNHHGVDVFVKKEFKGKHRDICLCYVCDHFNPKSSIFKCPIANAQYEFVVANGLVAPIMECPHFKPGPDNRMIGKEENEQAD